MYNTPNKGWLLDKDVPYGHPCANYKDTMKHKLDFVTRFGVGALSGSEQTTRTESDDDYTQRVRDAVAAKRYSAQKSDLKFLDSVLGFEKKSPKQMAIVQKIAGNVMTPKQAAKIIVEVAPKPSLTVTNVRVETGEEYLHRDYSIRHQLQGEVARMGLVTIGDQEIDEAIAMAHYEDRGGTSLHFESMQDYDEGIW